MNSKRPMLELENRLSLDTRIKGYLLTLSYEGEIARLRRELEARGGSAAVIAGPGPVPGGPGPSGTSPSRGDPDRPAYPRPEIPGGLPGGPPPLNGDLARGEWTFLVLPHSSLQPDHPTLLQFPDPYHLKDKQEIDLLLLPLLHPYCQTSTQTMYLAS